MIFVGIDTGIDNGNNKNEEIRESRGERRDGCVESHFVSFTILLHLTILLYFSLSGHSVILLQRSSSTNT